MSNIKANKVNDAGFLFGNFYQIESINLANFDLNNNAQFHYMFDNCQSLISLNFPNFNKKNHQNIENIFRDCNNLKYINIENAIINNEILSIFDMINSNQIICTHSPKLISIIKSKSAMLNCTNNYCLNQIEGDDCFSLNLSINIKINFMNIALMEHIMIIIIALIAMKNVTYVQKKAQSNIYVYHAIIQIIIMKNIIL